MPRVLLTWIGLTDLRAARGEPSAGLGPIAQAVKARELDHIVLLCDLAEAEGETFRRWLETLTPASIVVRPARLRSPTDYEDIYQKVRETVTWARGEYGPDAHFFFHLSPGTPPMAVIWILVGTTEKAELLQSSKEQGVQTVKVPFQIAAEFIPAIVQRTDADLERLAGGLRPADPSFDDLLHQSAAMKALVSKAKLATIYNAPLLLEGETGTGKELLAAAIHKASGRTGKFIAVNCGAIPKELVESEFFGHKKGAFTGATEVRHGHFEQANGGTLFLDEVGELPLATQVKLLRAIQEKKIVRVGESLQIDVDVRILSATNRNLTSEVERGAFRQDLYYRLAVLALKVPALRDRKGDVLLLAERLFERQQDELGITAHRKKLSPGAKNVLLGHAWPGNVRELEGTLLRALVWSTAATISEAEMRSALISGPAGTKGSVLDQALGDGFDIEAVVSDVARHYIERALAETHGNKTKAAQLIGLKSQQTLTNWAKRHGVKA
jgi:transcriptional regulator with PAS, ATPase and Fis domain